MIILRKNNDINSIVISNQCLINSLLHSRTQMRVYHLQTKSYSKHWKIDTFYKKMDELTDKYIETFQGKYGILYNYRGIVLDNNPDNIIEYLKGLIKLNNQTVLGHLDTDLDDIKDELNGLFNETILNLEK